VATETIPVEEAPRTPEEIERHWYENVYQGDRMRQLTPRALIMGMALGAVMTLSNIYVGLRAGWGLGVAITSSILAFAAFSTLHKLFPKQFPEFSILENNAMASAASAAGYMTGEPGYVSKGAIQVRPVMLKLDQADTMMQMYDRFMTSQAMILMSERLIKFAIEHPDWKSVVQRAKVCPTVSGDL